MRVPIYVLTAWLLFGPAAAQQGYDFLKRDNPFGSAEQLPQRVDGDFGFCWTSGPAPNTKNMIISNVFPTKQTVSKLKDELEKFYQGQGISVSFECAVDSSQQAQQLSRQKISSFSLLGYNISQVQIRPH
jgi:hypothetical protein